MPILRDVTDQEVPAAFIEAIRHPRSGRCLLCGYPLVGESCLGRCLSGDCVCCKTGGNSVLPHEEPSQEGRLNDDA